jgi:uncharacterized membrane protein YhhN
LIIFFITVSVLISAALHIQADYKKQLYKTYFFKPLTICLVILIGFIQPSEVSSVYRYLIIVGLIFSLMGDIFLMLPTDRFLYGLSGFFVAHIFYIAAFISDSNFPANYFYLVPGLIIIAIMLRLILPSTGNKRVPVILYSLVLLFLLWQALGRLDELYTHSSIVAFIGTAFFVFSDGLLAFNRFTRNFKSAQLIILSTYYTAQLCIVFSI